MAEVFDGAVVPLVTPFRQDEGLDEAALGALVERVLAARPAALMLTALTGEGPLLDESETLSLWETGFAYAAGRLPVVPTVITWRTSMARRLVRRAEQLGAHAVMVAPIVPELYAGRSHEDVYAFYADVAEETSLPLILFNYPSLTGVDITPVLVERLATIPTVAAIKESTGDARRVHEILRRTGDRVQVICGAPTTALESLALGCTGWITGIMNVAPLSARQLMDAVAAGDLQLARRIYFEQLLPLADLISVSNNPMGVIKAGVTARGVDVGVPRRPGSPLRGQHLEELRALCARLDSLEVEIEQDLNAASRAEVGQA